MDETMEKYRKVYEMLQDEESRDIYLNRLNWLISGNQKYLDGMSKSMSQRLPFLRERQLQI